jgi:multisubunit Na+/H+ antiporter MnhB subunit
MKWVEVSGYVVVLVLMVLYDWPKMTQQMRREKIAYGFLIVFGAILAVLLVFYPEMPGPTKLVDAVYKPLVSVIEKAAQQRSG